MSGGHTTICLSDSTFEGESTDGNYLTGLQRGHGMGTAQDPRGGRRWSWGQREGRVCTEAGGQRQGSEEVADEI